MKLFAATLSLSLISLSLLGQTFSEVSQSIGINHEHIDKHIMGGGAAFFDYNNDGFQDLYFTGGANRDQLFENNQDGTFTEVGITAGIGITASIKTVGVTTGDIDNDGDREIFVTTSEDHNNLLFNNNGDGTFSNIAISAGFTDSTWSTSASFGDVNKDGLLDIYVGEYVNYFDVPFFNFMTTGTLNKLYINNGDLTFSEEGISRGVADSGGALSVAFSDFNNDASIDLLLGNDFGNIFGGNQLFKNNYPSNDFDNISGSSAMYNEINAMGIAIGDYDEDLDLDYYVTNMAENLFHRNNNDETFTEIALATGTESPSAVSWGTFFFDYDNDTYLDLYCSSGGVMVMANPQQNVLYENQQNGSFLDVSSTQGVDSIRRSRGAVYGDIDNDGALELVVVNVDSAGFTPQPASLYKNNSTKNWLAVKLNGVISNRDAFGSRVRIVTGGRSFIREVGGGSSYLSQNSSIIHFGLDQIQMVDSLIVTWPTGDQEHFVNINANTQLDIIEGTASLPIVPESFVKIYPNPAHEVIYCSVPESNNIESIRLMTMDGKIVFNQNHFNSSKYALNIEQFESGTYQLSVVSNGVTILRKINIR